MSYTDSSPTKAPPGGSSPHFSSSPNSSQSPPPASSRSHDPRAMAKYDNSNSQDPGDRDDTDSINLSPSDTASVRRRGGIRRKYPSGDYGSGSNWHPDTHQNGGSRGGGGGGYNDDSSNSDHEYYYPDEDEQYYDDDDDGELEDDRFLGDGLDQVGGNIARNARNVGRELDRDLRRGGGRGVGRRGRRTRDDGDNNKALKLRLDLNLDVEVQLKASVRGDLTLSLL
ncbi:hypothetical protein K435DRAFT_795969 [Dendrothele bispora CBS 962.96]|uniref:Uncharacterized protein n=1 Tax=Dendrothele bispora (strain CBS 962.96) TaxID=1314807 RepID=A0A4S8M6X1_DENBC|nr:hypothetical protein K435DRAFT_795969 [Dendrothele bispora CBS 962.96]